MHSHFFAPFSFRSLYLLPPFAFCFLFNRGNIGPARSIGIIFFFFFVPCFLLLFIRTSLRHRWVREFLSFSLRFSFFRSMEPRLEFSPSSFFHLSVFNRISGFSTRIFFEISWVISEFRIRSLVLDLDNFLEIIFRIFKSVRLIRIIIFLRFPFFFQ